MAVTDARDGGTADRVDDLLAILELDVDALSRSRDGWARGCAMQDPRGDIAKFGVAVSCRGHGRRMRSGAVEEGRDGAFVYKAADPRPADGSLREAVRTLARQ